MNSYELNLLMRPELEEKQRDELVELVEKIAKQNGGEVTKREAAGKKALAYPISKMSEAWYYFLNLSLPPEAVEKLEAKLRVEEKLLRTLVVKKEKKEILSKKKVKAAQK